MECIGHVELYEEARKRKIVHGYTKKNGEREVVNLSSNWKKSCVRERERLSLSILEHHRTRDFVPLFLAGENLDNLQRPFDRRAGTARRDEVLGDDDARFRVFVVCPSS